MKKVLDIEGMMCQHCVAHVNKALSGIEGVEAWKFRWRTKTQPLRLPLMLATMCLLKPLLTQATK